MQETGRRGAPSLFSPLPRTGLCTKPCSGPCARLCSGLCAEPGSGLRARLCSGLCARLCSGPRARLCSGPHGGRLLPHHRHRPHHRRTAACAAPVSSASSPLTARRPHFRPHLQSTPPSASSSAARHQPAAFPTSPSPRACRCPAAFFRTSGVCFTHVTQQMYAHLFNTLKINMLQSRQKKTIS